MLRVLYGVYMQSSVSTGPHFHRQIRERWGPTLHFLSTSTPTWAKPPKLKEKPETGGAKVKVNRKGHNFASKYSKSNRSNLSSVNVWESMSITQLGEQTGRSVDDIAELIFSLQGIDTDYIQSDDQPLNNMKLLNLLAVKLGYKNNYVKAPERESEKSVINKDAVKSPPADPEHMVARPPVVTIMGHIDHGKTSLLDYLRQSRIVEGEHGGITQHIGAFSVNIGKGGSVTFIDTPGHAAFTAMRTRGANTTDIVILIIDSCEGVLDQTRESLRIIRQARVPFIVALNKIDKEAADIDTVKQQLTAEGVRLEEDGGDVQCVPISAVKGTNVQQLVESVLTLAEILELKADPKGNPEGTIIESQVEQGLGKTTTILLHRGTLKPSQFLVCDMSWCKVRLLLDDRGNRLKELKPSQAAKVVGWREEVPSAGSEILAVPGEARAKEVVTWRKQQALKDTALLSQETVEDRRQEARIKYEEFRKKKLEYGWFKPRYGVEWNQRPKEMEEDSDTPVVRVIIKGDVDGSVEALLACLDTYSSQEVLLDVVSFGIGQVTETDISLAQRFSAVIYAFNTPVPPNLNKAAQAAKVPVRQYNVIYHLVDDLKREISLYLPPEDVEDVLGRATVLQEFLINEGKDKVAVAGCRVLSGRLSREAQVRVVRGNTVQYEGPLLSLKHLKAEMKDIQQGQECGLRVEESGVRFEPGDQIVAFNLRQEPRSTDWNPGF